MLEKWHFPEDICAATLRHHDPPLSLSGLDFAVATSELVARSLWEADPIAVMTSQQLLQERFAVDVEVFIEFATGIQQSVQENAKLFSVNIEGTIDCEALLETARQRYMDIALDTATNA